VDKVAETLCEAFKGAECPGLFLYIYANTISDESRNIVRFGGDRRPSVTNLETMDIVVATAALQTGELRNSIISHLLM
jgi:hypothetical protein